MVGESGNVQPLIGSFRSTFVEQSNLNPVHPMCIGRASPRVVRVLFSAGVYSEDDIFQCVCCSFSPELKASH